MKNKLLEELENSPQYKAALNSVSETEQQKIKKLIERFVGKISDEIIVPLQKTVEDEKNIEPLRAEIIKILSGKQIKKESN